MKLLSPCPEGITVLLHLCCAPDAAHGVPAMQAARFSVTGYFFNPNIHPAEEHAKRLDAARKLQAAIPFPLLVGDGGEAEWEEAVRGLEGEKERGKRCEACVRVRLRRTAEAARAGGFDAFGSVLTVSRLKSARMVNPIGREEGERAGIRFVDADMGKNDGYNDSVRTSARLGIYRQDYCGCRYSLRRVKSGGGTAEEEGNGGSVRESPPRAERPFRPAPGRADRLPPPSMAACPRSPLGGDLPSIPEGSDGGKTWRKRAGIEPTIDVAADRPDLKSGGATSAPSASVRKRTKL